jgi:hypothetical protein
VDLCQVRLPQDGLPMAGRPDALLGEDLPERRERLACRPPVVLDARPELPAALRVSQACRLPVAWPRERSPGVPEVQREPVVLAQPDGPQAECLPVVLPCSPELWPLERGSQEQEVWAEALALPVEAVAPRAAGAPP